MHSCTTSTALFALAWLTASVVAQIVSPFATHDCSTETVYTGDHACNNNPTTCCAFSGVCCAGGCCPETAVCVFQGTSNEACCSLSDSTLCGSAQPPSSKTCPNPAGPSVPCSGVDSSWYCAPGCTCNDSRDKGCNCFGSGGGDCSGSGGGGGDSSSAAAPTSTYVPPVQSSSTGDTATSTPGVAVVSSDTAAATTATSVAGAQTTGPVAGGGSSTTASAPAAGTTMKASEGMLRVQTAWALGLGIVLLGAIVVI